MTPLTITAYTLRYLTMCERRIWLDQHGDAQRRYETPSENVAAGIAHGKTISASMFGTAEIIPAASWSEMLRVTSDLMRSAVMGIQGAAFERTVSLSQPITVRGRIDWLTRTSQPSQLGRWAYEPIEIKMRRDLLDEDKLQLDLYLWLLQGAQSADVSGWFWLGRDIDNQPLNVIQHSYDEARLLKALERAANVITVMDAPPVFLASHCETCPWHRACQQDAEAEHQVTLLPGLSRQTWEQMRQAGVITLDQILALSATDLQHYKGVGKSKAADFHTYAQAYVKGTPVSRAVLPDSVRLPGVMLDLETCMDGDIGVPWCFGWQVAGAPFRVAIVGRYFDGVGLRLPDGTDVEIVVDSDAGWRRIAEAAEAVRGPVYHWGSFEMGVLRATAPTDVIETLQGRLHDLNKTFKRTFALPVKGTSIKTVAPYFGFRWPSGTSTFSAWADYRAWLLDADQEALARACAYNRADVEAMALVWRWMLGRAD
jgi:predicted RecB family nuclease